MRMLSGVMRRLVLNEVPKKLCVILVIILVGLVMWELSYVLCFIMLRRGILGSILCGVYVFLAVMNRMWCVLWSYLLLNVAILSSYRVLVIGILPMLAFFVKVGVNILVL